MSELAPTPRRAAPWLDGVWLAALAGLGYHLARQDTFYGTDGRHVLKMIGSGLELHDKHYLYVPAVRACQATLERWGWSPYQAALLLSALGSALAVGLAHAAAARLRWSRSAAATVALLVGTAPAVLFYATVVELHAPFFGAAALAMVAAASAATRPSPARALVVGLATGCATGLHATGHFLWLAVLPVLAWPPAGRVPLWRLAGWAAVGHAAAFAALLGLLRVLGFAAGFGPAAAAVGFNRFMRASAVPGVLVHDWLLAFAPLSVAACCALPRAARAGWSFAVALLAYLALTFVLVAPGTEHGAYLLPLVIPAALLTVAYLPRVVSWCVIAIGLVYGLGWVRAHDDSAWARSFVAGVREVAGSARPILVCGAHREFDAVPIHGPELEWHDLIDEAAQAPALAAPMVEHLERWVRACAARGEVVLFTQAALDYLSKPVGDQQETGPLLRAGIERALRLDPVRAGGFVGFRLRARE